MGQYPGPRRREMRKVKYPFPCHKVPKASAELCRERCDDSCISPCLRTNIPRWKTIHDLAQRRGNVWCWAPSVTCVFGKAGACFQRPWCVQTAGSPLRLSLVDWCWAHSNALWCRLRKPKTKMAAYTIGGGRSALANKGISRVHGGHASRILSSAQHKR